ncbi:hypothetical protein [Hyalangium gracile]|uniref:hypothetical protein n=1 Tax=Hyalangium gracile TaxID=394092 RepID=UPI001CCBFEB8|nr:hypothetical protein [Hyalangium gracile]
MVLTAFVLLLLSAEPNPTFAVVTTASPELARVADTAGTTLAERLELTHVELGGHLKTMGAGCVAELRCLASAPGLAEVARMLHLSVRRLSGGRLAVELRYIDRARLVLLDRSAAIVEPGELSTWAEQAATRIFTRLNAPARTLPPSPFSARPPAPAPRAPPVAPPGKGVRGADEEP